MERNRERFVTTHWSVVLAAGGATSSQSRDALAELCNTYWSPIYAFVRRRDYGPEEAQDLTQEFFIRFLETNRLYNVTPEMGRFRSYLLASLKHFLINEWQKGQAKKRGGGQRILSLNAIESEEADLKAFAADASPEKYFDRRWALAVLDGGLKRLERDYATRGRKRTFEVLKQYLVGDGSGESYKDAAARLDISEGGVKASVHKLRKRYKETIKEVISQTLSEGEDPVQELDYLREVLRS